MRWIKRLLKLLVVLLVAALATAAFYAQRSLPQMNGRLQLGGLVGPVQVHRDASDVTHILASRPADAWKAMGYVHAQERGWQLEFNRRVMRGSLSEVMGLATLETDKLMRTLGILFGSGVPILDAMRIGSQVVENLPMKEAIDAAAKRVREGASLNKSLAESRLFPPITMHLIGSGEASGKLDEMLDRMGKDLQFMPGDGKALRIVGDRAQLGPMHPDQRPLRRRAAR